MDLMSDEGRVKEAIAREKKEGKGEWS